MLFCGVLVPYDIRSPRRFRVSPVTTRTSNIAFVIPVGFKGMADNDSPPGGISTRRSASSGFRAHRYQFVTQCHGLFGHAFDFALHVLGFVAFHLFLDIGAAIFQEAIDQSG